MVNIFWLLLFDITSMPHLKNAYYPLLIVHQCTESCQFINESIRNLSVEREDITFTRLEFQHDLSDNHLFCLNVYCMA